MMDERLLRPGEPITLQVFIDSGRLTDFGLAHSASEKSQLAVRVLRSKRMHSVESLLAEMAAALQFPLYFGDNWNALDECLADLSWLKADGYLLMFANADELLRNEPDDTFKALLELMERVGREWSSPLDTDQPWGRPAKPFHVILHSEVEAKPVLETRLHRVALDISVVNLPTSRD